MVPEKEDQEENIANTQNSEGGFSYLPCMSPRELRLCWEVYGKVCWSRVCFGGCMCCSF